MNDADDAESSKALALVVWPSGLVTRTWHVISKLGEYYWIWTCVSQLLDHLCVVGSVSGALDSLSCMLICSKEGWSFRHFLHLCLEEHWLAKCPGLRQLRQNPLSLTMVIF